MIGFIRLAIIALSFGLLATAPVRAQMPAKPLFASAEPLRLTLQGPLPTLIRDRSFSGSVPATLTDPSGNRIAVQVRLRGITRRTEEVCDFPPLRLDISGAVPGSSVFAGQRRLKLVTHCKAAAGFQQKVLLEYGAYRMYNVLTERSLRARLADISYLDESGRPIASRVGFFIEDVDSAAARNGLRRLQTGARIPVAYLSPADAARFGLYMHLLGNHDWSMRAGPPGDNCCHNAELIGAAAPGQVVPLPYDFDFSGLVNAPYATPPDALNISDVRQRLYRGYCAHNAEVVAAAREMIAKRPAMLAALASTPGLDAKTRASAEAYLGRFFADIASDQSTSAKVLRTCLG